jgi:hypothetical protein
MAAAKLAAAQSNIHLISISYLQLDERREGLPHAGAALRETAADAGVIRVEL